MAETPIGPGSVLAGRFTLDDLLDDTDGARFWRATDQTLARSVAVHVIAESDARADALLTAARTSALVTDGHLLRVLDAAAEDGVVYVVNEWGSGVSLDEMLAEGPLPPRRAAWVVKEVAEAIATAHRNGVAHGRLLPEKVMVTEAGSVKLIGFVVDAVLQDRAGRDQRRVTGGAVLSAHESDVVNLAALLYAALVGRWPGTEGSTVPAAPAEHGRPLRPRQVRAGVPRPLDAICERVLNAGPHTHAVPLETAHEIYAALSDYIGDPTGAPQYEHTSVLDLADDGSTSGGLRAGHRAAHRDPLVRPVPHRGHRHRRPGRHGRVPGPDRLGRRRPHPGRRAGLPRRDQQGGLGSAGDPRSAPTTPATDHAGHRDGSRGLGGFSGWSDPSPRAAPRHRRRPRPSSPSGRSSRTARPGRAPATATPAATTPTPSPAPAGRARTTPAPARASPARATAGCPRSGGPTPTTPTTRTTRRPAAGTPPSPARAGCGSPRSSRPSWCWSSAWSSPSTSAAAPATPGPPPGETSTSPSGSSSRRASTPVAISGVTDFDPQGDPPEENPDLAPLAADGKQSTAWRTSTYYDELAKLKDGVGLLRRPGQADRGRQGPGEPARRPAPPWTCWPPPTRGPPRPAPTAWTRSPRPRTPAAAPPSP